MNLLYYIACLLTNCSRYISPYRSIVLSHAAAMKFSLLLYSTNSFQTSETIQILIHLTQLQILRHELSCKTRKMQRQVIKTCISKFKLAHANVVCE